MLSSTAAAAAARRCTPKSAEALFVLILASTAAAAAASTDRPSIVFVLADDMGIGDVGAYNPSRAGDTPHMDKLAEESLVLTNFRVMSPVCSPSRASLMTGMESSVAGFPNIADCVVGTEFYVDSTGNRRRVLTDSVAWLNETWASVAHALRDSGYYTAHLGKWHVGCEDEMPPPDKYGWDLAKAWNANAKAWPSYDEKELFKWLWQDKHRMSEEMVKDLGSVMDRESGPFYASVNPVVPHSPLSPRREHMEAVGPSACNLDEFWADNFRWSKQSQVRYMDSEDGETVALDPGSRKRRLRRQSSVCVQRVYRASVYSFDVLVGDILALLDERGLAENTLLLVTSDNGPEIAPRKRKSIDPTARWSQVGLATPHRGVKRSLYEGGIRVPCLVRWPRTYGLSKRLVGEDILSVDLLPTFARIARADTYLLERPDRRRVGRVAQVLVGGEVGSRSPRRDASQSQRRMRRRRRLLGGGRASTGHVVWEWAYDLQGPCDVKAPRFAIMDRDAGLKLLLDFSVDALPEGPFLRKSSFRRHELYNLTADPAEKIDLLAISNRQKRHNLWAFYGAPLAAHLVRWVRHVLPRTAGRTQKYHAPCVGAGTSATDALLIGEARSTMKAAAAAAATTGVWMPQAIAAPRKEGYALSSSKINRPQLVLQPPTIPRRNRSPFVAPPPRQAYPSSSNHPRRNVLSERESFEKNQSEWFDAIYLRRKPDGYRHLRVASNLRYWCADSQCYAALARPPGTATRVLRSYGPPSRTNWLPVNSPGSSGAGFLVVTAESRHFVPDVDSCANWTVVRVDSCGGGEWPSSARVVLGPWYRGTECPGAWRIGSYEMEAVYRLPEREEAENPTQSVAMSAPTTVVAYIRQAFPNAPMILVTGKKTNRRRPKNAPIYNSTWETIFLDSVPGLSVVPDTFEKSQCY